MAANLFMVGNFVPVFNQGNIFSFITGGVTWWTWTSYF